MDPISPQSTLDGPSDKVYTKEVPSATVSPSTSNVVIAEAAPKQLIRKHIIRRITPLDLKKLQRVGLDRKIAEALSKHKSQQKSKILNTAATELKTASCEESSSGPMNSPVSKLTNVQEVAPVKTPAIIKKRKPPTITITGPDTLSELEKQKLADLDPHERLVHVKNMLNKKILEKKSTEVNDNAIINKNLKPPRELCDRPQQYKLPTKPIREKIATTNLFTVLKEAAEVLPPPFSVKSIKKNDNLKINHDNPQRKLPTKPRKEVGVTPSISGVLTPPIIAKPTKTKTPQKTQEDIARKLEFQTDSETEIGHHVDKKYLKLLNKDMNEIPKASTNAPKCHQQSTSLPSNITPNIKQLSKDEDALTAKQSYFVVKTSKDGKKIQYEVLKQQKTFNTNEIPKASIKTAQNKQSKQGEVCPLSTDNVAKETPLPVKDSFKKPYQEVNSAYYDIQHKTCTQTDFVHKNYETPLCNQQPPTSNVPSNLANNTVANNLIVLENKVLTQEEMIDLTDLRLSTSKFETPRFINPHRPIPELVIKQEHIEEFPANDILTPIGTTENPRISKSQKQNNKMPTERRVVIPNKQYKKIIINAQKLKLPPEQLADLARKMKQKISTSTSATTVSSRIDNVQDKRIPNTEHDTKHTSHVLPCNTELIAQGPEEIAENLFNKNKHVYGHAHKEDHNYQYNSTHHYFQAVDGTDNGTAGQANIINPAPIEKNMQSNVAKFSNDRLIMIKDKPEFPCSSDNPKEILNDTTSLPITENGSILSHYYKSAVEIIDEPIDTADCFSAVDFIVALSKSNPTKEEICLELSPEEHNLNDSCTVNLSSSLHTLGDKPGKKTQISQRTSTPKMGINQIDDSLKSQEIVSTVNTEISESPVSIQTDEGPKKYDDLKKIYKLQTVKATKEIETNNSLQTPSSTSSNKNSDEHILTSKPSTDYLESVDVCDMEIGVSTETQTNASPRKLHIFKKDNSPLKLTISTDSINTSSSMNMFQNDLGNEKANKTQMVLTTIKQSNDKKISSVTELNENKNEVLVSEPGVSISTTKALIDNITTNENKSSINILESNSNPRSMSQSTTTSLSLLKLNTNEIDEKAELVTKDVTTVPSRPPANEISKNNAGILKLPEEIEASKVREITSNNIITSKRVSKFKKGKINLVQRNKAGQGPNKPLSEDKNVIFNKSFNVTSKNEDKIDIENKITETHVEQIKTCDVVTNIPEQTKLNISSKQNEENIEDSQVVKTATLNVKNIQNIEKSDNTLHTADVAEHSPVSEVKFDTPEKEIFPQGNQSKGSVQEHIPVDEEEFDTPEKEKFSQGNDTKESLQSSSTIIQCTQTHQKICDQEEAARRLDSQHHLNSPKKSSFIEDVPNVWIQTGDSLLQQHQMDLTDKKSTNIGMNDEVIVTNEVTCSNELLYSNEIASPCTNTIKESVCSKIRSYKAQEVEADNLDLCFKMGSFNDLNNLNQESKTILETMRSATISLIDVVKHSPIKSPKSSPVIPFEKTCSETSEISSEVKGSRIHLHQTKSNNKEQLKQSNKQQLKIDEQKVNANRRSSRSGTKTDESQQLKIDEQKVTANRRSSRCGTKTDESRTDTPSPPKSTRKKHSKRPLISDDDLEFLPENAEVDFKLSKLNQKEKNKEETNNRVQRPQTKPMKLESLKPTSSPTNRTRYYSQTLDTDVTVTFDTLKSKAELPTNLKPMKTDGSSHDSTHESGRIPSSKQHKKLCKTVSDRKSHKDTDSEDDNPDFGSVMIDSEENSDLLGFEEIAENTQHVNNENDCREKTTHGTVNNWFTTDKDTSPTFENAISVKRSRNDEELPQLSSSSSVIRDTKGQRYLEKRWDICSFPDDEIVITDDTSPADDEEDVSEKISSNKKFKRIIKNVIDCNKELIVKKIKLDNPLEQSFVKPPNLQLKAKKSGTGSDCPEEKARKSQKPHVIVRDSEEGLRKSMKSKEVATDFNCIEKIENVDKYRDNESQKSKRSRRSKSIGKSKKDMEEIVDIPQPQISNSNNKIVSSGHTDIESESDANTLRREMKGIGSENSKDKAESQNSFTTPQNLTTQRKRGRPRKKANVQKSKEIQSKNSKKSVSSDDEGPSPLIKRLKRAHIIEDSDSDSLMTTPLNTTQDNESLMNSSKSVPTPRLGIIKNETPKSSGRPRKSPNECKFNARLLLITKREQLDTDEILTETNPASGSIQCGLCLNRTEPAKWLLHLAEHYGVGWKVGEEKLHVENRSIILSVILKYMKATNSNGLTCRMCKKMYRSALGILMHIESCGTEAIRVMCEFCKREYVKSSFSKHVRSCLARNASEDESPDENNKKKEEIVGNTGRLKRNSTIKAENKLKVIGAELEQITENAKREKSKVDPKSHIKYVAPMIEDHSAKWSKDIEEFGQGYCPTPRCKFSSNDVEELSKHLKKCVYLKSGYLCNFCRQAFNIEKEAIEHVVKNHQKGRRRKKSDDSDCNLNTNDEQSSDDTDLSEGVDENELTDHLVDEDDDVNDIKDNKVGIKKHGIKTPYSRGSNQSTGQVNRKEVFDGRSSHLTKEVFSKWKSFLHLNYSSEPLYTEFTSNYSVVNQPDFNKYLPTESVSMKFSFGTKPTFIGTFGVPQANIEWSQLQRYETISNKENTYFFLGAPIKLCSWLPLPDHVNEQYMAVVYRHGMFKYIKSVQPKQYHSIVLILKMTQNNNAINLNIHYGFMVNDGPIHHLSFLPSGGYDASSNRLGIVAVATVTSSIKIFSLPLNIEFTSLQDNNSSENNITLIDIKPSFILNLDILTKKGEQQQDPVLDPQCLQICWSEHSGHQHIFAGFSNGFVGIWDIVNDPQQNLNRFEVDGMINYVPLSYFYIGEKSAKCIALHYDTGGPRWLAVAGAHRKFFIYDIKNFMQPIIMKEDVNKNILLSVDWCPVWETVLYSYCDTLQNNGCCLMVSNPNNIMFSHHKVDAVSCGVTQVHYTPVTNMCVTGLSNGEIVFLNTKELHYECVLSKRFGQRRMLSSLDVQQLNGQPLVRLGKENQKNDTVPSDWTMFDVNYKEKYGLIFHPLLQAKDSYRKTYASESRCPPVNIIPFMRINTLRCNLNLNAKHFIAVGYENGFLRLVNFNKDTNFSN